MSSPGVEKVNDGIPTPPVASSFLSMIVDDRNASSDPTKELSDSRVHSTKITPTVSNLPPSKEAIITRPGRVRVERNTLAGEAVKGKDAPGGAIASITSASGANNTNRQLWKSKDGKPSLADKDSNPNKDSSSSENSNIENNKQHHVLLATSSDTLHLQQQQQQQLKEKRTRKINSISLDKLPSLVQHNDHRQIRDGRDRLTSLAAPSQEKNNENKLESMPHDSVVRHDSLLGSGIALNNATTSTSSSTSSGVGGGAQHAPTLTSSRRFVRDAPSSGTGSYHSNNSSNNSTNNNNTTNNIGSHNNQMPKIESSRKERGKSFGSTEDSSSSKEDKDKVAPPIMVKMNPNYIIPGFTKYLYYLKNMGNNTQVLKSALQRRPWWQEYKPTFSLSEGRKKEAGSPEDGESQDTKVRAPPPPAAAAAAAAATTPQFLFEQYRNHQRYLDDSYVDVILNHIENNHCLVSKKGLYYSIQGYCDSNGIDPTTIIPLTFYLTNKADADDDRQRFLKYNNCSPPSCPTQASDTTVDVSSKGDEKVGSKDKDKDGVGTGGGGGGSKDASLDTWGVVPDDPSHASNQGIWILKPASRTNRGFGIKVVKGLAEVMQTVMGQQKDGGRGEKAGGMGDLAPAFHVPTKGIGWDTIQDGSKSPESGHFWHKNADRMAEKNGWIVQQYMQDPLLVSGRKFDIRCYCLLTLVDNDLCAYFFKDMYVRTSSKKYSLSKLSDREAHLTNDAVQKNSKMYGKFENGNKLSMEDLQACISRDYPGAGSTGVVAASIIPEIKRLTYLSVLSGSQTLNQSKIRKSFEVLGYDYMIDAKLRPYLIEVNSNPCLEFVSPALEELITSMINGAVSIAIDPHFPPPTVKTKFLVDTIDQLASETNKWEQIFPTFPGGA